MKFKIILFLYLVGNLAGAQKQKLDDYKIQAINTIIKLARQRNVDGISKIITFPLNREYPIPSIKNEKEFKTRFNQIFDETLLNTIAHSKISQWSEVGWRGIMLDNGTMWIDTEGNIIAVNYQTDFEKKFKAKLIAQQKKQLHPSLQIFSKPIYTFQTKKHRIRIDELKNGDFRYTSWKVNASESTKPELVLLKGKRDFLGSGGNHVFTFSNGIYTYKVYRNSIGADDDPDVLLEVVKGNKTILSEGGTLLTP